jgi:hypothetical protein
MDQQGQGVLDDMIENGESPRAISDKFWEDTYWKLPGPVQERFQKQLSAYWGGMKPGDTIGSRPDKSAIVARDWWDLAKESDLPTEAEYLEGTDRGYVVLMREANERFGGGPEKVQKGTPEKKPDQLTGGEENRGKEVEPKFKHGNTQADIPPGSDAGKALARMRKAILPEDLAGEGMVNDSHITVRYGIDGGDTAGIRAYLEKQAPFEATLGKTQAFPPSEHSDGAAPIVVPVESADLRRMEKEIDKHGNFVERSFPEYKPHATLAYVKPEEAHRYTGMTETGGQKFTVKSISITDRNGNSEEVQLKGISKPQFSTAARAKVMDRPARTDQIGGGESKPIESSKVEAQPKKPESLTERFKRAQQAKADKYLDTQVRRESGQVLTRRQIIDERMAGGGTTSIKQVQDDAAERKLDRELGAMRRAGVPTGNQSHPTTIKYNELRAQQKAGIKVPSYRIHGADGTEWVVSKTEHDYAQSGEGKEKENAGSDVHPVHEPGGRPVRKGDEGGGKKTELLTQPSKREPGTAAGASDRAGVGKLGDLLRSEEGSFTPAVVRDALANATEPLRDALERYAAEASRAEDIQKGLIHTERAQRARTVRVIQTIERLLKKEGFTPEDGKQVFRHIEDSAVRLTPKQAELRDKWIVPMNEAARQQYTIRKLIQSGKFPIEDILAGKVSKEDIAKYAPMVDWYMHRIAAGHNVHLDRIMAGVSKRFGGKRGTLSRALSAAHHAVFQEAHSPSGQREVVAIKGGRVRQFINSANIDVLDGKIADLQKDLQDEKAETAPNQERADRLQNQIWDLKAKRAQVETDGVTTIDLGAHKSGYVTTDQLADEAVKPLEKKLAKIETEERTLRATPSRMSAATVRLRNIAVQKADLERQIAAVRASVGPEQAAVSGMGQDEILSERLRPVQAQIDRLTKEQAKLNATPGRTPAQDRRVERIGKQLRDLEGQKGDIEDAHASEGLQGRYWRDKFDGLWKFNRGTTEFISGRTGQQYYDNAILSSTVNYLETTRAAQAAAVIESQKAMLEGEGLLSRETDPTKVPDGWKRTQLMQMLGLSFPPHIADAYDQFAEKMGRGSPDLLDKINRFNVQMVLMNPLMHGKNVVSNWITGKLAEGIASGRILNPVRYVANAKAGIRALNAVWSLNEDYLHPLEHGLDLLRTNPNFDAGQEELIRSLAAHLALDKETAALWKKALGIPGNILEALRHINHTATFGMNDLFTLQAYYSALDRFTRDGIPDPETAARDWAHRQVVEYRPPVRFMGSRAAEKVLENPKLSAFWAYHSDLLRQVATAVGDAAGVGFKEQEGTPGKNEFGQGPAAVHANGLAKLAVMAAIAAALYPLILDPLAKKLTGDDRAKFPRAGLPGLASNVYESAKGERDWSSTASGIFTLALGTENMMEMVANRDFFTGRHIRGADQDWKGQVQQLASWLGKRSLAGQLAGRIDQGEGKQAMFALTGFTFPMEHGLKEAAEIRRDKAGSNPPDPEKSKVFQSILAAAEQARRSEGNDTRLADALEDSGKLSKGQEREMEEAILWPPIVFATNGMNPEEVYRVFEKSTEDEKRDLLNPESSTAGIGKSYPNTARKALGKYLKDLSDADKDSEATKVEAEFDQYGGVD